MPAFWLNPNSWPDGAFRSKSTFSASFPAGPAACVLTASKPGLSVSNTVDKAISFFTTLVSY
jgi:hypothetical protein